MKNDLRCSNALKALVFILTALAGLVAGMAGFAFIFYEDFSQMRFSGGVIGLPLTRLLCGLCGAAGLIAFISGVIFLCDASGHHKGADSVQPGWGTSLPFDLVTAAAWISAALIIFAPIEGLGLFYYSEGEDFWTLAVIVAVCAFTAELPVLGWLMSAAVRFKLGGWWKNTLCFYVLQLAWRFLKWLWAVFLRVMKAVFNALGVFFRAFGRLLAGIPLIWKGVLVVAAVCALETIVILFNMYDSGSLVIFWFIERLVLVPVVIYLLLVMRKLQNGAAALANGELTYKVDTKYMLLDFKSHGEDLNRIAEGSAIAVEQRLKSERFKTELITNVSHDIKTPLTSIINYSDLISSEQTENENIHKYAEVISRQSGKLKRLLEDLVEASKAATGNLEIDLLPCDAGVLLDQAAGEYEDRLSAAQLTLITHKPEDPVRIMADSRRIWRVFDNLMNNVCKYAQPGTRVYLSLERSGSYAQISLKNISAQPLNISADELLERFVRGDSSRSTEGSGLGLSIAKSLTELQHGSFEIAVDGDLFKVTLRFPLL